MRVLHEGEALATDVERARSWLGRAKGLMFRTTVPNDYALVMSFGRTATRGVHTVFVRTPIDVIWVADDAVTKRTTLPAWTGLARATADTIIELAPGAAADVARGDRVVITDDG